jgi:hypothetical protein
MEITLLVKEGSELMNTHCWTIKGDLADEKQFKSWKDFLYHAERWGRGEALDQLRMIEQRNRRKRLMCVKDDFGNLYNHTGNHWREGGAVHTCSGGCRNCVTSSLNGPGGRNCLGASKHNLLQRSTILRPRENRIGVHK